MTKISLEPPFWKPLKCDCCLMFCSSESMPSSTHFYLLLSDKLQNIKFEHDMFTQRRHCKLIG